MSCLNEVETTPAPATGAGWLSALTQPRARRWYVGAVLAEASETGRLIAAICGATVAVARAGLLDDCRHTSNSLAYLQQNAVAYDGANYYHDGPYAVFDGNIVTAPGTAPVTFTREVLRALQSAGGDLLGEG